MLVETTARRPRVLAAVAMGLLLSGALGRSPSLSDRARAEETRAQELREPFDTAVCEAVRTGIAAYNSGDIERAVRAFDDALPLAQERARRLGSGDGGSEAKALLEAVEYYAGLSPAQLDAAFPASPETREYQVTTLSQCQPLPPGLDDAETPEQQA